MKKRLIFILAIALLMMTAGCGSPANEESEVSEAEARDSEISDSVPATPVESSEPEDSSDSTSDVSSSESGAEESNGENFIVQTVPAIDASVFYDANEGGANLSVLCTGVGRYWLSYENSKSLLAYLDFTRLTPTDQTESMEIDSADPGIVFTASGFSYELRLDQNTNIAVYEIGGSTRYYYTMPEGFYDTAYEWASTYAQYNYNDTEDEALNVTTGFDPGAGES